MRKLMLVCGLIMAVLAGSLAWMHRHEPVEATLDVMFALCFIGISILVSRVKIPK